jgi:hypothetical protein
MSKGGKSQTVTTAPDPRSQGYIDRMRGMATGAAGTAMAPPPGGWFTGPISGQDIGAAMDPYMANVIGGVRGEFDHLRGQAAMGANQQATMAGAFGGSRAALMQGARMGELDRAQTGQIGGLLSQGYGQAVNLAEMQRMQRERQLQSPLYGAQQGLNFMNLGMGPMGQATSQPVNKNPVGMAMGGASVGSAFGPIGAGIGGGLGLLGGLLF